MLVQVGVDVFGGLLPADAETLHQMAGGQATFPPGNRLDQPVTQCQIPANLTDRLLAFHARPIC